MMWIEFRKHGFASQKLEGFNDRVSERSQDYPKVKNSLGKWICMIQTMLYFREQRQSAWMVVDFLREQAKQNLGILPYNYAIRQDEYLGLSKEVNGS